MADKPTPAAPQAAQKILVVDDEPNVLVALKRHLNAEPYSLTTVDNPETALDLLRQEEFGLVIADYLMPKMNGVELLRAAQQDSAETVRILFTAYTEANIAIDAINEGGIYRYILKPWNGVEIKQIIKEALAKFSMGKLNRKLFELTKLQNAALIEKTKEIEVKNKVLKKLYEETNLSYLKSVQVFTGLLEVFDPYLMQHSKRVAEYARLVCEKLGLPERDKNFIEFGSLLHDIGLIGLPKALSRKKFSACTAEEKRQIKQHTIIGQNLVNKDVKFEEVGQIIRSHHERYDGEGFPDELRGTDIPLGGRIVAVVDAFDSLLYPPNLFDRSTPESVKGFLYNNRKTRFDPQVVDAFLMCLEEHRLYLRPARDLDAKGKGEEEVIIM